MRNQKLENAQSYVYLNSTKLLNSDNARAFVNACFHGHLEIAQWILSLNPDIDVYVNYQRLFNNVCVAGHLTIAEWLLFVKPTVLVTFHTAFYNACVFGHLKVAKWVLYIAEQRGLPINGVITYYNRIFIDVCKNGRLEVAKWILTVTPEIDIFAFNNAAFCDACLNGKLRVVQWLYSISEQRGRPIDISADNDKAFRNTYYLNNNRDLKMWFLQKRGFFLIPALLKMETIEMCISIKRLIRRAAHSSVAVNAFVIGNIITGGCWGSYMVYSGKYSWMDWLRVIGAWNIYYWGILCML